MGRKTMTITVGTNSYVTRQELIDYAAARGITVPDTSETDVLLINATDFMETYEGRYVGSRATAEQALAWPRQGVVLRGFEVPEDEVPELVKQVQKEIALDLQAGVDLYNRQDRQIVTRERVDGAVEVAYATPNVVGVRLQQSKAMNLLRLITTGGTITLERR